MSGVIKLSSPATHGFWEIPVLFEDEHLLALDKPSGLPTSPDPDDAQVPSLMKLLHTAIADGNAVIKVQVSMARGVVDVPRGSYYVPLNQPMANLVMAALEPDTQSSYFANQIIRDLHSTVRVMAEPSVKLEDL